MKYTHYILLFIIASFMVGCSNDDMPVIDPDGAGQIRFGVDGILGEQHMTRAEHYHRDWSALTDPSSMGVFGFSGGTWAVANEVFNNQTVTYVSGTTWTYSPIKYWQQYYDSGRMDFLSYMPYVAGATLSSSGSEYTLTIPNQPSLIVDSREMPLVCHAPVGYENAYYHKTAIPMVYDQVYNRYDIQFKLHPNMAKLRTFRIVKVEASQVPARMDIRQKYTFSADEWTKGETEYSAVTPGDRTGTLSLQYRNSADTDWEGGVYVGYRQDPAPDANGYTSFDRLFYMIPGLTPKLRVTYIIYDEENYETRETVSEITLNTTNFPNMGNMALDGYNAYKINILIVPDHLYVLSDADQTSGILVAK